MPWGIKCCEHRTILKQIKGKMLPEIPRARRKVFFYIDGFNLYHRRLEREPRLKWLCLKKLATEYLFPGDDVVLIKFFTAKVDAKNPTPSLKQQRQMAYWDVLRSTGIEIIEGLLEPRDRQCKSTVCDKAAFFGTMTEKMSDVNLALHVYRDFIEKRPDVICVLSADLDVVPALRMVRETKLPVMIKVLLPTQQDSLLHSRITEHYQMAITNQLSDTFVRKCVLPEKVEVAPGDWRICPDNWK
jgi:hypothetical protein